MKIKFAVFLLMLFGIGGSTFAQNSARMLSTPNAQTGTSYTFVAADTTRVVTFSNAGAVAVTLPNGATLGFGAGTMLSVVNLGAGAVTITCSSCTINGAATLVLSQNSGADIYGGSGATGVNYIALPSPTGASFAALGGNNAFTGTNTFTGTLTFTNHNALYWAGPGATPTIDQAIASCGANPCVVEISPLYTGAESTSLFTNSLGYKTFTGGNNVTVKDMRACSNVSPTLCPIYGILYGGRLAGQLNREGVSYYASSPADSSTGITSFNWVTGTMPSNGGLQAGSINALILHDGVTWANSLTEVVGTDSELHADATSADNPILSASSYGGGVLFSRTNAAQNVLQANVFRAKSCAQGGATAIFFYCYGFRGDAPTGGTYRNFSFSSQGDFLFENSTKIWAEDSGTVCTIAASPTGATESGQTVTITTTAPCAAALPGQHMSISGVGVAGYNIDAIVLTGTAGTTFTYYAIGTSGLAASGSGSATPKTPRAVVSFTSGNLVNFQPLSDSNGWRFKTQAGTDIVQITSSGLFATTILGCTNDGTCSIGANGASPNSLFMLETTAPTALAAKDVCYGDSTAHALKCNYNNSSFLAMPQVIASGTATFTTTAAATLTCQTTVTVAATGGLATDAIEIAYASAPTGTTDGLLILSKWMTAGNVNFQRCNPTAGSITPTALVLNWRVIR